MCNTRGGQRTRHIEPLLRQRPKCGGFSQMTLHIVIQKITFYPIHLEYWIPAPVESDTSFLIIESDHVRKSCSGEMSRNRCVTFRLIRKLAQKASDGPILATSAHSVDAGKTAGDRP